MKRLLFLFSLCATTSAFAVPATNKACKDSCLKAKTIAQNFSNADVAKIVPSILHVPQASQQRIVKITREAYVGMVQSVATMCSDPSVFRNEINETLRQFVGTGGFTQSDLIEEIQIEP